MTAQGAFIKLEGGNIMIHGPGKMEFKASTKELAGPQSAIGDAKSPTIGKLQLCEMRAAGAANAGDSVVPLN
jgi:type VI secretion system secreted protein VgrG